jgi:hypothetical protein
VKGALWGAGVAIFILLLLVWRWKWFRTADTIDIHFHDTYIVLYKWHAALLLVAFIGFFTIMGSLIYTGFRNR